MSDSGEMSEFGYIMELLARGKVSGGARGAAAAPPPPSGTTWPPAVGAPLHSGDGLGSRVPLLSPASRPLQKAKWWLPFLHCAASLKCANGEFPACLGLAGRRESPPSPPRGQEERALSPRRWGSGLGVEGRGGPGGGQGGAPGGTQGCPGLVTWSA